MRTPRPRPNKLHDELDALLDGRPVELTDELAPLAEVAEALRAELAAYELDPEVADRHLERVLDDSARVVRLPVRTQPHGWDLRRRLAAVVLAAALVLAPATFASAAALPGQAMYPFKRAIEELRIASVQWSPGREAVERTRVADARTEEVQRLTELRWFNQLPPALTAMAKAVSVAKAAVDEAKQKGEPVAKVEAQLNAVVAEGVLATRQAVHVALTAATQAGPVPRLSDDTLAAITTAAQRSEQVLQPVVEPAAATAPTATTAAKPAQSTQGTSAATQPSGVSPTQSSTSEAPTTVTSEAPTTVTTSAPTTTLQVTESSATPASAGDDVQAGTNGQSGDDAVPATTAAPEP